MNEEFFAYLDEARRVLKPGGRIVFSFLDIRLPSPQAVFQQMVGRVRRGHRIKPLNVFFGEETIAVWAGMLGMRLAAVVPGNEAVVAGSERVVATLGKAVSATPFGQSIAVLEKTA
jgi:hypothetical protein